MNWFWHLVAGIIFSILAMSFFGFRESYFLLFLLIPLYVLISDIDHKNSKITWIGLGFALLLCLIGLFYQAMFLNFGVGLFALVLLAVFVFKHRGFTHSLLFGLIICVPIFLFFGLVEAVVLFFCFYSHLLMDGIFVKFV